MVFLKYRDPPNHVIRGFYLPINHSAKKQGDYKTPFAILFLFLIHLKIFQAHVEQ